jgi:hypothetical protein
MTAETILDVINKRDEKALAMKIAGKPITAIAQKFAWTVEETHEAIERALIRTTVDRNPEGVSQQRMLTVQRLESLLEGMWPAAKDDSDPIMQQGAVKTVLGIVDRQTALYGTNAPKETTVTHQISPDQVAATIERLFAARSGVVEAEVVRPGLGTAPTVVGDEITEEPEILEGEIVEDMTTPHVPD